jgi:hypothetical protein
MLHVGKRPHGKFKMLQLLLLLLLRLANLAATSAMTNGHFLPFVPPVRVVRKRSLL